MKIQFARPSVPRTAVASLAVATLALSACGSDSDGGSGADAEARERLQSEIIDDDFPAPPEEQECVVDGIVDSLGGERVIELADSGDLGDEFQLPQDEAEAVADAVVDCVSFDELIQDQLADDPSLAEVPQSFVDCILGNLDGEVYREALAAEFSGNGDSEAIMESAFGPDVLGECFGAMSAEELAELTG
ncbi:MAG: hypothetical protein AAGD33_14435 [Actinomycetota bacterium]